MPETLLEVRALDAFYGDFQALFGVSLTIAEAEIVAVIGANGAGKSTLLNAIAGLAHVPAKWNPVRRQGHAPTQKSTALPPGSVVVRSRRDAILFQGDRIGDRPAYDIAAGGISLVPEGRRLFASLSVEENLLIGGQLGRAGPWDLRRVYGLFPVLAERRHVASTALSGGQQQMVAIGRALMANPKLLLCDEISLGLAPIVMRDIYRRMPDIVAHGTSVIVVEQDIVQALAAAQRVYCLQEGRVALQGPTASITREAIASAYFGV